MGYFLLFEAMLDSVLYARDKYLSPNGILAPSNATILLAPFEDDDFVFDKHHFWDQVYGFDFSSMKTNLVKEAQIEIVPNYGILATPRSIKVSRCIDLNHFKKLHLLAN